MRRLSGGVRYGRCFHLSTPYRPPCFRHPRRRHISRFVYFTASQSGRVDKAISTLNAMVSKGRTPSLEMLNVVLDTCIKGRKTREVKRGLGEAVL